MSRYGQSEKVVGDTAHRSACLNMPGVHCEDAPSSSVPLNEGRIRQEGAPNQRPLETALVRLVLCREILS